MITEDDIINAEPRTILIAGVANTSIPNGAIKFVAVRGGAADWAVYIGSMEVDLEKIRTIGDKLTDKKLIQRWTEATEGAMRRYRE